MTSELLHGSDNLVLMCKVHHSIVDDRRNEAEWPPERLQELKERREAPVRDGLVKAHLDLADHIVRRIIDAIPPTPATVVDLSGSVFHVGGQGGQYGGSGGDGGVVSFVGLSPAEVGAIMHLDGLPGSFGGGGGGGGVLELIGRSASEEDLHNGLAVSSFFFATDATYDTSLSVVGGAWEYALCWPPPTITALKVVVVFELGIVAPGTILEFRIDGFDPSLRFNSRLRFDVVVPTPRREVCRVSIVAELQVSEPRPGVWTFVLASGDHVFVRHRIEVRMYDSAPPSNSSRGM